MILDGETTRATVTQILATAMRVVAIATMTAARISAVARVLAPSNQRPLRVIATTSGIAMLFRRLHSRLPVPGPSMPVRHGHDQDTARFDAVDDAEWKAPEQVSTCALIEPRPYVRKASDGRFGCIQFIAESHSCRGASFCIPAGRRLRFCERLLEILNLAGHVRLPRECGDAPRTTEWSWPCPRRLVRAETESRRTMPPLRRRRSRSRDSESARPPGRLALRQKAVAPRTGAVWHP